MRGMVWSVALDVRTYTGVVLHGHAQMPQRPHDAVRRPQRVRLVFEHAPAAYPRRLGSGQAPACRCPLKRLVPRLPPRHLLLDLILAVRDIAVILRRPLVGEERLEAVELQDRAFVHCDWPSCGGSPVLAEWALDVVDS